MTLSQLKHGPGGTGGSGPCDPNCAKCKLEAHSGELFDRELAAAHAHMDRLDATTHYYRPSAGPVVGLAGFTPSATPMDGDVICNEPTCPCHRKSGDDEDHATLVAYLLSAVRRKDWHAVSDAANDIRCLEASRR